MDVIKSASFLIGSLFIALGGVAGVSMADHNTLMTMTGFILAALGYRSVQIGFRERKLLLSWFKNVNPDLSSSLKYLEILFSL